MDREEILLKEYEICEQDSNSSSSNYWLTVQIFVGIITAILGGLAYAFATQNLSIPGLILVIVFSFMVIFILKFLYKWLKRVNHLIGNNNRRMREIEVALGMRKNIFVWGLDHWEKIPQSYRRKIAETWEIDEEKRKAICESDKINDIPKDYRPPLVGHKVIERLLLTVGAPWVVVIVIAVVLLTLKIFSR